MGPSNHSHIAVREAFPGKPRTVRSNRKSGLESAIRLPSLSKCAIDLAASVRRFLSEVQMLDPEKTILLPVPLMIPEIRSQVGDFTHPFSLNNMVCYRSFVLQGQ